MKKAINYLKELGLSRMYWVGFLVSIGLLVVGFILPPQGVIDGTVLIAVAEIMLALDIPVFFAFATVNKVKASVDLDDKKLEISSEKKHENEQD